MLCFWKCDGLEEEECPQAFYANDTQEGLPKPTKKNLTIYGVGKGRKITHAPEREAVSGCLNLCIYVIIL